ncbi:M1 family aminopeptidase, partial [Marinobacter alexandrii]|uniref:M1 family aminopeptidase n=1 Tax=Marinobacter alexandrii TaxID=2570351 RepID=UPI003296E5A5
QHDLNFLMRHYPGAYSVDRSDGSNPIRQNLINLNQAGQMYGSIIYLKAPIMMRQLELTVGEQAFRTGLQQYLKDFAFANATWPDLIAILDSRSTTDLETWSKVWVNTAGRPSFRTAISDKEQTELIQQDSEGLGRIWPQQFSVTFASGQKIITSNTVQTPIPDQPLQLNSDGLGYGLFPVEGQRLRNQNDLDDLERGALLIDAWENFLTKDDLAANHYLKILLARITVEENALILEQALSQLYRLHASFLNAAERAHVQESMEDLLRGKLESAEDPGMSRLFFNALREITMTTEGLAYLQKLWSGEKILERVPLSETDSIQLAEILALRQPQGSKEILASQREQIENPDLLRRFDYLAPTLSMDTKVRDDFFQSLAAPENRATERWALDALGYLHHPARVDQSEKYILPSLELLEEVQVTGDIFFPSGWLNATLRNQRSPTAVEVVHKFLRQRPDYNPQLRMKILQAVDMAERASRSVNKDSAAS